MPLFRNKFEISDELLNDLRSKFLEEINSLPAEAAKYHPDDLQQVKCNDWYIARYILHQDYDVDNALKMMKKSLQFRKEREVNTMKKEDLDKHILESRMVQMYNYDKENFPVLVTRIKVNKKVASETRLKEQHFLYWLEKAVRKNDWGAVVSLYDCTDIGFKNVDLDSVKNIMNIFNQYYPWTCRKIIVYNMPWYLTAIWNLIKAWIPEKHLHRVVFVDKESILEYIDKDKLPVSLGGTCTDQYEPIEVEVPSKGWF